MILLADDTKYVHNYVLRRSWYYWIRPIYETINFKMLEMSSWFRINKFSITLERWVVRWTCPVRFSVFPEPSKLDAVLNFLVKIWKTWWPLNQSAYIIHMSYSAFAFDDAEVTAAGSNIVLGKIRSPFNRKLKWRTWYWKYFYLKLQMEYLWNFKWIRIFCGSNNIVGRMMVLSDVWVRNQRWRPVIGSGYEITYISACMHDCNEILTAIPVCFRGQATRLH